MEKEITKRQLTGTVVSTKMNKTIVVRVDSVKVHAKYDKQYKSSKKFHVHDEHGTHKVGETVTFIECRPLSKTKRWMVVK